MRIIVYMLFGSLSANFYIHGFIELGTVFVVSFIVWLVIEYYLIDRQKNKKIDALIKDIEEQIKQREALIKQNEKRLKEIKNELQRRNQS